MSESTIENTSGVENVSDPKRADFAALASQVAEHRNQLKESLRHLQECLDRLRLASKYQAFDLEATRRENVDLKALLELND